MEKARPKYQEFFNSKYIKKKLLRFMGPVVNNIFKRHNPKGIKFLIRLRPGLNHLLQHKFKHSFHDTVSLICRCSNDSNVLKQKLTISSIAPTILIKD